MKAKIEILNELDKMYEEHKKKHGNRVMSDKELRELLGL
jgi:hypothetical protein